jgi:hypothetical protein
MGPPQYLNVAVVAELIAVWRCEPEPHWFEFRDVLDRFQRAAFGYFLEQFNFVSRNNS